MVGDRWEIGDREVAADTLSAAKEEAERVLRLEGIDLEWFTCARNKAEIPNYQGCAKLGVGPAALALSLLPRSMSRKLSGQRSAFGYAALVPQGQGYPIYASVFVDRAAELVDRFNALGGVLRLRGVHANEPDGVALALNSDLDGISINHSLDVGGDWIKLGAGNQAHESADKHGEADHLGPEWQGQGQALSSLSCCMSHWLSLAS